MDCRGYNDYRDLCLKVMYSNEPITNDGTEMSRNFSSRPEPRCENILKNDDVINIPKNHNTTSCFLFI